MHRHHPRRPRRPAGGDHLPCAMVVAGLVLLTGCGGGGDPADPRRPQGAEGLNVVLVLSDALRASNLPLYGYPRETAPRLGELAEESVVFARHHANYPGTPISVSQMQSGRLMPPLLMDHSFALAPVAAVGEDLLVLPKALREAGYRTGIVTSHPWFNERARLLQFFDQVAVVPPRPGEAYAPFEELLPPAEEFLDGAREPFFLYVHSMDTHGPFRFHEGFDGHRDAPGWPQIYNAYDSEILYTDHGFGRLVDELRRRGLLDRTIVVFTSDHGEELGEMGPEFWNRSHGQTVRRVQLHVPLLIRLPDDGSGRREISAPTTHLDLAPTLLRLARPGHSLDRFRLDGRDLSAQVRGDEGREPAAEPILVAYSWRYWGLYRDDMEIHYDQWQDRFRLHRTDSSRFNYPMSVPLEDAALEGRLAQELRGIYRRRIRESLQLPANGEMPAVVPIGVPTTLVSSEGPPPTFERDPEDDRWFQNTVLRLEAAPGERPGAVTLATPWVPGEYRIFVRLSSTSEGEGFENRFLIRYPTSGDEPVAVDGSAAENGLVATGVHRLGRVFMVEVSAPEGGVAITGFVLRRMGADRPSAEDAPLPEDLEERLRALGYVD